MKTEEIFREVLKSTELHTVFQIPQEKLEEQSFNATSEYPVIEIIKAIINGQENHRDKNAIFQIIQRQIMQL